MFATECALLHSPQAFEKPIARFKETAMGNHYRTSRRSLLWVGLLSTLVAAPAVGQRAPIPTGSSDAEIIARAEADGAAYPYVEAANPHKGSFIRGMAGGTDRRCYEGIDLGPVRSGEFVIGGQLSGARGMRAGLQGKVWWAPFNHSRDMPPLEVRGRSLSNPADSLRYTTATVAWPVSPGSQLVAESAREYFFPSGITMPAAGRWVVIATSGNNWGCFILTVR
jgi:hypothetical protein